MALTKYPEGSIKELASIAFPLMLTSFSVMLMLFVDRLMLANYSLDAHNAAVKAATFGWAFLFGASSLAAIAEVFVAQYNGAGEKRRLGEPVWQMIWFSLATSFFFAPLAIWGTPWFYGHGEENILEKEYFSWMMIFCSSFPLYAALSAFFIGQGKTALITWLSIVANVINAILDYVLIFGIEGLIPSMGVKGAAIATVGGTLFQVAILGAVFLNQKNRTEFGTGKCGLNFPLLSKCLKIGIPGALFCFLETLGFAAFYYLMTFMDIKYITITGICQSIIILFYFYGEGISKAAMTVAGNLIGAKRPGMIGNVIFSGIKLHFVFLIVMLAFLWMFPDALINQFITDPDTMTQSFYDSIQTCFIIIAFYMFFEGVRILLWGILTSAGDTMFLLTAGTISVWTFLVLPVYLIVVQRGAPVEVATLICLLHGALTGGIYLWRFMAGKWKSIAVIT